MISTRFTARYGVRHPIASAGMAFVGTAELALAVDRAGGLGAIGVGLTPPPALAAMVEGFRAATEGPLNLNFITCFTDESYIDLCVVLRPAVVSFHWGHPPRAWIERLQAVGVAVWEQVGSALQAQAALADGVDLLVVQGTEAGGHNLATLPTFAAIPEVRRAVGPDPLLLAAGGVTSGAALAGALALGADGAWVGSRLVASEEADAHPAYKQALVEAQGHEARLSSLFGRETPGFNPMRVLANAVVRDFDGRPQVEARPPVGTTVLGGQQIPVPRFSNLVPTRATEGDLQEMPLLAGQGVGQIDAVRPVGEILPTMVDEAAAILRRLAGAVPP